MISTFLWTTQQLRALLPRAFKLRLLSLFAVIVLTSIVDIFGLAAFIPVIAVVVNPDILESNQLLSSLQAFTGVEDGRMFTLALFIGALFFFLLRSVFIIWSQHKQASFSFDLSEGIAMKMLDHLINLPFEAFTSRDSNKMIRELNTNPQQFSRFLIMQVLLIISEMVVIAAIVVGIAVFNLTVFALLMLSLVPAALIFHRVVKARISAYGQKQNELIPRLQEITYQAIFGYVDIKLRDKAGYILSHFGKNVKALNHIGKRVAVLSILPAKLFEVLTMLGLFLIFCYGFFISDRPEMVLPILTVYLTASYRLIPSLGKVIPAMMNLDQYRHLFDIYREPMKSPLSSSYKGEALTFKREIAFAGLGFSFDSGQQLLRHLDITIKKGETLGLIGRSGSGKTTLVRLLLGFYQPTAGQILIDGLPLTPQNIRSWRAHVGYVQQSHFLIRGTLTENVAFGETPDQVDHARLQKSIEHACLNDFAGGRNPDQIQIEEYGKNLSGGQKQRVVIARALYHEVDVLILDEATSALDIETEQEINQTIKSLKEIGLTLIIIAHRFTTLKHSDHILELKNGRISRVWSYDQLEEEAISY